MGAIVAYIGNAIGSKILTSAIVKFVVNLAVTYALSRATAPNLNKLNRGKLSGAQIMSRSALEYSKRVYGSAMVSGPIVYQNLTGANGRYLWVIIALTDHKSSAITSVWFDGDKIPVADIDWTPDSSPEGSGDVSTVKWVGDNSTKAAALYWYLGDPDQLASNPLLDAGAPLTVDWTSAHRLRGCTYLVARLLYDEDTAEIWGGGPPDNIKAVLEGCLIYDPRLDSTQIIDATTSPITYGSGSHRTTDASTWAHSDNPSLAIADYLTQVMGVATTKIDWPSIADAADDCDVLVEYDTSSPVATEKRFTLNGALSMGESHKDNLSQIQSTMDGRLYWSQGKWRVRASVWKAPTVTITEDELIGDIVVRGSSPKRERYNLVRGFYVDFARLYEAVEFPHVTSSTYLTRDNDEEIALDLKLPLINSATEAQRVAWRALRQSNNQKVIEIPVSGIASNLSVGDTVTLNIPTLGWTAQTARITDWKFQPDGTFKLTCREDYEASYADPAGSDYGAAGTSSITAPTDSVPAPTDLVATAPPNGIQLDFTPPPAATYDFIEIYEGVSDGWNDSPGPALIARMRGNQYFMARDTGFTGYYWIRAIRMPDLVSNREPSTDPTTVTATAGSQTQGALGDATISDVTAAPTDAVCGLQMNSVTGAQEKFEGTPASPTVWTKIRDFLVFGSTADMECYLEDLATGTTTPAGSAVDTWLTLDTTRTWTLTQSAAPSPEVPDTFFGTLKLRNRYTEEILSTASISMSSQEIGGSVAVSANTSNVDYTALLATCYAGVQFNSSGVEYKNNSSVSQTFGVSRGDWLDVGAAADAWVERSISGDSLNWKDEGAGRHQLNTTREFGVSRVAIGLQTSVVTFDFYDAAVAGNLLDSVTITLQAEYDSGM